MRKGRRDRSLSGLFLLVSSPPSQPPGGWDLPGSTIPTGGPPPRWEIRAGGGETSTCVFSG